MHVSSTLRPGANDPVRVRKYPIAYGPKNPPRLPKALISPIDAAAADSARNSVGNGQKLGKNAVVHAPTTTINTNASAKSPLKNSAPPKHAAPINSGIAVCQRRSRDRSECQPLSSIATAPAA